MSVTHIDLVDNNDGEQTSKGYRFTRTAIIEDPSLSSASDKTSVIYDALNDADMPSINDPHPALASCKLAKKRCSSVDVNTIYAELVYETPNRVFYDLTPDDPAQISMDSSLIQVETSKDGAGASFSPLSYTYLVDTVPPWEPTKVVTNEEGVEETVENTLDEAVTLPSEIPLIPKSIPHRVYTVVKMIDNMNEDDLEDLNQTYQGTINHATWRTLYAAKLWLCIGISWRSTDLTGTFEVTFRFEYNPSTWDVYLEYMDPTTGKVPSDVIAQGAYTDPPLVIYPTSNFSTLSAVWS